MRLRTWLKTLRQRRVLLLGWRSLGYVLGEIPVVAALAFPGLLWTVVVAAAVKGGSSPGGVLVVVAVGCGLFAAGAPLVAMPLAKLERWRLRLVDPRPISSGHRGLAATGPWRRLSARYREPATWREVAYAVLLATAGPVAHALVFGIAFVLLMLLISPLLTIGAGGPVAVFLGTAATFEEALWYALPALVALPVVPLLLGLLAAGHAALARALLHDGRERLRTELVEVSRSRARLVDAFEVERRRIERDLHDGAQQRLVGLTLKLGLARLDVPADSSVHQNVSAAHDEAKQLMAELRELVRGIHPRVLTDRGLPAALGELADRCPIPVALHAGLPDRFPAHVEVTAYFVVAEALTNIAKHSAATAASVTARHDAGVLAVEVADDGRGGADPARGTGLTGLADRVAVIDGKMLLSSPVGGPTLLRVELPCPVPSE
ncbi:sensor domain-containing protein [Saccharopolyspora shandongensis]|uniref:sensor histidine kinase n=1 Tax=Saccharopolyspora shandongensis TaxID=418495 RepID=UPI0033E75C31